MKNIYLWTLIKHQFKVSNNWSGEIAFFHILTQKICLVPRDICAFFATIYLDMNIQNIVLFSTQRRKENHLCY